MIYWTWPYQGSSVSSIQFVVKLEVLRDLSFFSYCITNVILDGSIGCFASAFWVGWRVVAAAFRHVDRLYLFTSVLQARLGCRSWLSMYGHFLRRGEKLMSQCKAVLARKCVK